MAFSYHTEQWLPYPSEEVFAFLADPHNLLSLLPPRLRTRLEKASIVPPPSLAADSRQEAIAAGIGSHLTLSLRPFSHLPVRVRWEAEIAEFDWNKHFCDRQVRGPFAWWYNCHRVRAVVHHDIPVTLIVDHIEYELPFGLLGRIAHRLFLRRQIERMFAYRQGQLAKILARVQAEAPPIAIRPESVRPHPVDRVGARRVNLP